MDERLGCLRLEDTRHDLELIWPTGRCVALNARHPNMVTMSAVHWKSKFADKKSFRRDFYGLEWTNPRRPFHLNRNGRFLDAARFLRVGGTDLVLVHCPDFASPP